MLNSLRDLYRFGPGPSSSHTIGPYNAARDFAERLKRRQLQPDRLTAVLFGSLALTGRGHLTDKIIRQVLGETTEVVFDCRTAVEHPNTLRLEAYASDSRLLSITYRSLGGGTIAVEGEGIPADSLIYPFESLADVIGYLGAEKIGWRQLAERFDGPDIGSFADQVFQTMSQVVDRSLAATGEVAGPLHVKRIARDLFYEANHCAGCEADKRILLISSYAYAVSEANAAGEIVVTAPTCGSAGVLPAVLCYLDRDLGFSRAAVLEGLIAAGIVGLLIKKNATISGAVGGCQAEIGSATAMAAAALVAAAGLDPAYVDYAAEVGLEHQLGLTCDPVDGYVAIPCIERNSIAALKAYDAYLFARHLKGHRRNAVSFDQVVAVMLETGQALSADYRETSIGGLAKLHKKS